MKRISSIACLLVVLAFLAVGCGYTKVPAQYEGVKINTLGTDKGGFEVLTTGRHFYNPWKYEVELFPMFKQNVVWTSSKDEGSKNDDSITFPNSESLPFKANIGISFSVKPGRSVSLYQQYRKGIEDIVKIDMRNSVRDAFVRIGSQRDTEGVYGSGLSDFTDLVNAEVQSYWKDDIIIHKVYLIGALEPPKAVINAINAKIAASQLADQKEREIQQAKADRLKAQEVADAEAYQILAKAKAEAESIRVIQEQLAKSPQYTEYLKAQRWDGKLPQLVGSGVMPMVNLN